MMQAAMQVLEAQQAITQQYGGLLHFIQGEDEGFISNKHYPRGDRIDHETGAQYFYHCHREDMETEEHGHFHVFYRKSHISKRRKRLPCADGTVYEHGPMTHLICISLNRHGQPCRLFTANRWVTKELLYAAEDMHYFTTKFNAQHIEKQPEWREMDQWVNGMMRLFLPQIQFLQTERDEAYKLLSKGYKGENLHIDRDIEELSSLPISLEAQVAELT